MKPSKQDIEITLDSVLKPALLMDYAFQTMTSVKNGLKQKEKQLAKRAFDASSKYFNDLFRDMGIDNTCMIGDKCDEFNEKLAKHIQVMKYSFQEELMHISIERRLILCDVISVNVVTQLASMFASALCNGRKDFDIERVRKYTDELMDEISNKCSGKNVTINLKDNENIQLAVKIFINKTLEFKTNEQ